MIWVINIGLWVISIMIYIIVTQYRRNEKLEKIIQQQAEYIETTRKSVDQITKTFDVIDQQNLFRANDYIGHAEVFKHSVLSIIADESCIEEDDVLKCHNYFHGVNIKLMKCGGITPALRMIQQEKS